MNEWRGLVTSPRAWAYGALSSALLLGGIDLEFAWDLVLPPFKPLRLVWVIVACAALATYLGVWLRRQLDERAAKRRFVVPFAIGFALLPVAGIGAHEVTAGRPAELFPGLGDFVLSSLAFIFAVVLGAAFCAWVLVLVYYVRSAERSESIDGPQLVTAVIASGVLGLGALFSLMHLLLIGFAKRGPELMRQGVVWGIWGAASLTALTGIAITARSRTKQRRWLGRVRTGRVSDYAIEPLWEHPEWAKLPPYLTAPSYSGVLVYEPEDETEDRELLGRVE